MSKTVEHEPFSGAPSLPTPDDLNSPDDLMRTKAELTVSRYLYQKASEAVGNQRAEIARKLRDLADSFDAD